VRTRDLLGADTCAALLLDEDTQELVARAAVGIEEEVEQGVRIPLGLGFAGRIAAECHPVVLDDVDHADVLNPILHEKGIKSLLGVPLIVRGDAIGVLHVGTLTPRVFGEDDVQLLQLVAGRVAVAIDRSQLYEAEQASRRRLEQLQAVTDVALAHLELEDLLDVLLPRIREILHADTCAVLLLDPETDELVARSAVGIEEEVEQGVRIPLGLGFAGRIAAERHPVVLDDVDHADVLNPILREKGIKSLLGVPLLSRDSSIGVLHVGTLTPRVFTSADVELLELVAQRVATAIERARLHAEVVELDRLKANFVAVASHELRTPATTVYGALATIVGRDDLPTEVREELIVMAHDQGLRLILLLEQLLDLSRLDSRRIAIDPQPIVLHSVLERIVADSAPPDAGLRLDVPPDLAVVADALVLDRVLSNLVSNAFAHGAPPVVVSAEQRDRQLRIAVEDSGGGVPEELVPRLFERFERGGTTGLGTGLGLAIAQAYARAHGGDVVYEPGLRGARFELLVPD
jgi:signal transduction histidine kinase